MNVARADGGMARLEPAGRVANAGRVAGGMVRAAIGQVATARAAIAAASNRIRKQRGPRRLPRASLFSPRQTAHFLLFSYSSTYFFGFALNSSRQPLQQT